MNAAPQPLFDWLRPNYAPIFAARLELLQRLRSDPRALVAARAYYCSHIAQFITHWGCFQEPRNVGLNLPTTVPALLFPRQVELVDFIIDRWRAREPGLVEKSRDSGMSWIIAAVSVSLCALHPGTVIGIHSRKEALVDNGADPSTLFAKVRAYAERLPREFVGPMASAHMRNIFANGSSIVGDAGDNPLRGARASIVFADEFAFAERSEVIEASISQVSPCRIYCSTPNGRSNQFAEMRFSGRLPVFTLHWSSDPRRDQAWYEKQKAQLDPVTLASELDIDYAASVSGILIPPAWVQSAIGAAEKLGITVSGGKYCGLDIADEGRDLNAVAFRHGIALTAIHQWSGKGSDIFRTVVKACGYCDDYGHTSLHYDADGMGAGVRGDMGRINEDRAKSERPAIRAEPFRGSGEVWTPDSSRMCPGRKHRDYFANAKAQAWFALRQRFQATFRAVVEGLRPFDPDSLISVSPQLGAVLQPLCTELSQPTYSINSAGKILIDKQPENTKSPNLADAVMIAYQPGTRTMETWLKLGRSPK